jgi:hypothetical protein
MKNSQICKPNFTSLPPVVTIYDEIDAHIGGRAVKAMAQLRKEKKNVFASYERLYERGHTSGGRQC